MSVIVTVNVLGLKHEIGDKICVSYVCFIFNFDKK